MWNWIKNTVIWFLEFLGFRVKKSAEEKILNEAIKKKEADLKVINDKLDILKKDGVDKKSLQEEIDYWKGEK